MSTKNLLLATLGGAIVSFLLGYLLYAVLLGDFFASNSGSATGVMVDPDAMSGGHFLHIFLGNAAIAGLMALIFGRWANISTVNTGLKAGGIIGLLVGAYYNFISLGTTNILTPTAGIADIIITGILGAFTGASVAWILGKTAD